ncbi:SprT family zinc-dependent metalloprotease [Nguyenibacter sp. L1]|nr:SprT family zinc-dependent metalloprotease [Nguyenibacter sp. L1]WRH86804.1 SprT family zinc-dependent metalloprotease [Nguyenibacter sp. L1]
MMNALSGTDKAAKQTVSLEGRDISVFWRHSLQARRVTLRIDPRQAGVVVTLPPRATREAGLALLRTHAIWIFSRLDHLPPDAPWHDGGQVLLDGRPHAIRHCPHARGGVWIEGETIMVSGEAEFMRRRLGAFLRQEARRRLSARMAQLAEQSGLRPRRLAIKDTSSRWGSCNSDGTIMLSWRLLMAPAEIQHYVIAHELAHLRHLNHGSDFWMLVASLTPHRHMAETWLRRHGPALLRMA